MSLVRDGSPATPAMGTPQTTIRWQNDPEINLTLHLLPISRRIFLLNAVFKNTGGACGTSGVAAMQLSVVTDRYVILFDKAEQNPLKTNDGINAWSALLDTQQHTVRPLKVKRRTVLCAGGSSVF